MPQFRFSRWFALGRVRLLEVQSQNIHASSASRSCFCGLLALMLVLVLTCLMPHAATADVTLLGQGACEWGCNGVAGGTDHTIYLTDGGRIITVASTGAIEGTFGSQPVTVPSQPDELAINNVGDLLMSSYNGPPAEISPSGSTVHTLGAGGYGIATDGTNTFTLAAGGITDGATGQQECAILRYAADGSLVSTNWLQQSDSQCSEMAYSPLSGDLYVVDSGTGHILEESTTATQGAVISETPVSTIAGLVNPAHIAIDPSGDIYTVEGPPPQRRIDKLSPTGSLLGTYTGPAANTLSLAYSGTALYAASAASLGGAYRIDTSVPIASVDTSDSTPNPGQSITLAASSSSMPFGHVTDYQWDLDGSGRFATDTGTAATLAHVFSAPGTNTVSVRVTGSNGGTATATVTITVPSPPSAAISEPATGGPFNQGQAVQTSFSCTDGNGGPGIASCVDSSGVSGGTGHLDTSTPGSHTYAVTATSDDGQHVTTSRSYMVIGPPTATISQPAKGQSYPLSATVPTGFYCSEAGNGPGVISCQDSNGNNAPSGHLDTSSYGMHTYTVTAISRDGQRTRTSISYIVAPPGRVGFVINNGDYATNNPRVTIDPVWPLGASSILVSNDGGFGTTGNTNTFDLAAQIPWTLRQTGSDRLPKTIYLRYLGTGMDDQNFTDDIILDEQAPTLSSAQFVGALPTAAHARSTQARGALAADAPRKSNTKTRRYSIRLAAQDRIVGLCQVAISSHRGGGRTFSIKNCHRKGLVKLTRVLRITSATPPRLVRVKNAAGTWSRWRAVVR